MRTLESADVFVVAPQHVGRRREQLELLRPQGRCLVGSRQELEGIRPGSPCEGLTTPRDELGLLHATQSNREATRRSFEFKFAGLFVKSSDGLEPPALFRACSSRAATGIRNRALIVVLYRGGLRLGEALALRPKDVELAAGTITILHGKGDRSRTVGLDPGAAAVLERWLERRRALGIGGRAPLFCTLAGRALKPS
jgi:hypothetical protein